ncbi:MAG: hypothetical protein H6R19_2946 [Proteobacteria bacterium]|nr:hypothetical protein [Pseudomonadota bacterium]
MGGGRGEASLDELPTGAMGAASQSNAEEAHSLRVQHQYHDEEGVQQAAYTAKFSNGSQRSGVTNAAGNVALDNVPEGAASISFKPDGRKWERLDAADNPDKLAAQPADADFDTLIDRTRSTHGARK